ncbi:MAG: hypothetical protein JWQ42_1317 [Edaphobacter sp.]|nr:hypothetical protein [Edaphobacter sp.]
MGRARDNPLSLKPVLLARACKKVIVRPLKVPTRGKDIQSCIPLLQSPRRLRQVVAMIYRYPTEQSKLIQIRGNPVNQGQQPLAQQRNSINIKQIPARAGAHYRIQNDRDALS